MHTFDIAVGVLRRAAGATIVAAVAAALPAAAQQAPDIPKFSSAQPGGPLPGWQHLQLASFKSNTEYRLVTDEGAVVLRASSHNAASYLGHTTSFDPHHFPTLSWRWKIVQGIPDADTNDRRKEDAPARLMVSFDGDASKLPLKDRVASSAAK